MNCVEFERDLPECVEGSATLDQQAHLSSCPTCAGLLSDFNAIALEAALLAGSEEPSPAVWASLEARLRSEGLIRGPELVPYQIKVRENIFRRWRMAWLIPVAAALAIVAVVKLNHPLGVGEKNAIVKQVQPAPVTVQNVAVTAKRSVSREDELWLNSVAERPPAQLASYRADLDQANAFIEDAEQSLKQDPNDAYTQQMLINAYQQKQMLYELAVDRNDQ